MGDAQQDRLRDGKPQVLEYRADVPARPRIAACLLLLLLYAMLTFVAIVFLEPDLTPPGFTGRGFAAMGIIVAGGYNAGRFRRLWWPFFFLYGCMGVALLFPSFVDSRLGLEMARDDHLVVKIIVWWTAAALACGALTAVAGWAGAKATSRRERE